MDGAADTWRPEPLNAAAPGPPDIPREPMEFLSRSWSVSALEVSKALLVNHSPVAGAGAGEAIAEEVAGEVDDDVAAVAGSQFTFSSAATSQLVMERIMSQSEASPRTCGRLSNSSGSLTVGGQCGGSLTDSPPFSPSVTDDIKIHYGQTVNTPVKHPRASKTVGRWLKDRRQRKKDEARVLNAELHAAISVAGVAAAVAAIAAATAAASASGKDDRAARTDLAVASAATLVASQCVEVAESMGAEREILAAVVGSAVSVRTDGDIVTLTAAAATALRGAATLKARTLKDEWNLAAVTPVEKGGGAPLPNRHEPTKQKYTSNNEGAVKEVEWTGNFLDLCNQDLLARGAELLKRTRKGSLHWKTVSVYVNQMGQVMLKMKSSHVAGTFVKKKKSVIIGVCKDIPAWPGRHLLEGGERRRYFGLRTSERRVIEFECKGQKEYEMWTQGVSRLIGKTRLATC